MTLEHLVPINEYVPTIYKDVKEMDAFCNSQDFLWDTLVNNLGKEYTRMFIQTADEIGVERFERIAKITADPSSESLDFRKERLLSRCNSTLPYTTIWLRNYLNSVLGQSNYELKVDYKNLIIQLYGYLLDYSWSKEVGIMIRHVMPANVVFINIPTLIENIEFQEWWDDNTWNHDIWHDENIWNEFNVIPKSSLPNYTKLPEEHEHTQIILNELKSVRLNGQSVIEELGISVQSGTIYVEFLVPDEVKLLTYVEVLDKQGFTLLYTPCYVDTPTGTKLIIRITCYEKKES